MIIMSRCLYVLALTVTLTATFGCRQQSAPDQPIDTPRVELAERIRDLGVVPQGKKVVERFRVVNRGQGELAVSVTGSGCACTGAVVNKPTAAAGEAVLIELTWDTSLKEGPSAEEVTIASNDPQAPEIVLGFKAVVEPEMVLSERFLSFDGASAATAVRRTLVIRSTSTSSAVVRAVSISGGGFEAAVRAGGPGESVVEVVTMPTAESRRVANLIIHTTSQHRPDIVVPLRASGS